VYVITNGQIVTPDEVLSGYDLVIENEWIRSISRSGSGEFASRQAAAAFLSGRGATAASSADPGNAEIIDAAGAYVIPGLIDIHADYIEHMAAPRPTSVMDFGLSLRESERELITHGVTTMYHSLAIYDFTEFMPSPIRSPEYTQKLISIIDASHDSWHMIRHRFHARFEIDNLRRVDELRGYIRDGKVHLLSFMDHTPGQGQYRDLETYRKTLKAYRNLSDEEVGRIVEQSRNRQKLTADAINELSRYARDHGLAVASHDDDSIEKLDLVAGFGTTISEFPITLEVAREARSRGMHTVAGAPNILLGGSHSGNLSAAEAILDGSVDVLCSDYYPASLLHAVFKMHRDHGLDLASMIALVTVNPARAVLMDSEIGSLAAEKRADVLIVREVDGYPSVTDAFVDGERVYSARYRRTQAGGSPAGRRSAGRRDAHERAQGWSGGSP
jgi:alpha-D-ribose 1-methylphosphonate 5-triphosphate diphosphatase